MVAYGWFYPDLFINCGDSADYILALIPASHPTNPALPSYETNCWSVGRLRFRLPPAPNSSIPTDDSFFFDRVLF